MDIRRLFILLLNVAGCMLLTASGWMVFNVVNPLTPPVPDDVTVLELTDRAFRDYLLNIPLARYRLSRTCDQRLAELRA